MSIDKYYPSYLGMNINNKKCSSKKIISIVRKKDYALTNLLQVSSLIMSISNLSNVCYPLMGCEELDIGDIESNNIHVMIKKNEYMLCNQESNEGDISLYEYLYNQELSRRFFLSKWISIYQNMCKIFVELNKIHIVLLELHPDNIKMKNGYPKIGSIERSIIYKTNLHTDVNLYFNKYEPQNILMPIEYHIICYLECHSLNGLSFCKFEEICDEVILNSGISSLQMIKPKMLNNYNSQIQKYYGHVTNHSKKDIINVLLEQCNRWNTYSLSMLYIIFLRDLFKRPKMNLFEKNLFLKKMYDLLVGNVLSMPNKRHTPEQNMLLFNNILYEITSSDFKELIYL